MNLFVRLFIILLVILPTACNKKQELVDPIKDTSLDLQMIEAYKKGLEELNSFVPIQKSPEIFFKSSSSIEDKSYMFQPSKFPELVRILE